ncbi:MAG: LysR family transcriptional regulator [Eggerthellaceae bacterium]|nr:LysR family transcriptional regulator [Eggerthellaceae bacterium]
MNIEVAREYVTLVRCLSFTEASKQLNITQSALSKHLIALEKEFGCQLLDRSYRHVTLTEAGRILFDGASQIIQKYEEIQQDINALAHCETLRFVGDFYDSDDSALALLSATLAKQNGIANIILEAAIGNLFEKVASGEADLTIEYSDPAEVEQAGLACKPFVERPLIAVFDANHPLANRDAITLEDLKDQTLLRLAMRDADTAWDQIERLLKKRGIIPNVRPIAVSNQFTVFTTPLEDDVLIWKSTERNLGLLLNTERCRGVPIIDEDAVLTSYAIYRPDSEARLEGFWQAVSMARSQLELEG